VKIGKNKDNHSDKESHIESDIDSHREAAICDDYLFGDYDYIETWIGITTTDA
jgi:hypothetical protein